MRTSIVAGLVATLALSLMAQTTVSVGTVSLVPEQDGQTFPITVTGGTAVAGMDFLLKVEGGTAAPRIASVKLVDGSTVWGTGSSAIGLAQGNAQTMMCGVYTGSQAGATVPASGTLALVTVDTTGVDPGEYPVTLTVNGHPTRLYGVGGTRLSATLSGGTIVIAGVATHFTILATASEGGTIAPAGTVTVTTGGSQEFTFTAEDGYQVLDVVVDGTGVGPGLNYTFDNVQDDHTIHVTFGPPPPQHLVTVLAQPAEGGTVNGAAVFTATVDEGSPLGLLAEAAEGFDFSGWSGGLTGTDNPVTLTVTGPMTILATFAPGEKVACGSVFTVDVKELENKDVVEFSKPPKVTALYTLAGKQKKASAKMVTKIPKGETATAVDARWIKKVRLYDAKALKASQKGAEGMSTSAWLRDNPVEDLALHLQASGKENKKAYAGPVRWIALTGPQQGDFGSDPVPMAEARTMQLNGHWFGLKAPKVWIEYRDANGVIRALKMKVVGHEFNEIDGASATTVEIPETMPDSAIAIIVQNGVGILAIPIDR